MFLNFRLNLRFMTTNGGRKDFRESFESLSVVERQIYRVQEMMAVRRRRGRVESFSAKKCCRVGANDFCVLCVVLCVLFEERLPIFNAP